MRQGFWKNFPFAALVGAVIVFEMALVLMGGFRSFEEPKAMPAMLDAAGQALPYSNTKALGRLLYTEYLYPIEVAAVILLVGMIAAIALTLRKRKDSKIIEASVQIYARPQERVRLVKMEPTRNAEVTPPSQIQEEK